jgi:hypothetical protein
MSRAGDAAERKAETRAQRALSENSHAPGPLTSRPSTLTTSSALDGLRVGSGRSLSPSLRRDFEPRFGADLSQIRIHDDPSAHHLSRTLGANAFTLGRDVVFGTSIGDDAQAVDRRLVAHELAHATSGGDPETIFRDPAKWSTVGLGVPASPDAVSGTHDWGEKYAAPSRATDFNHFYVGPHIVMSQICTFDSTGSPHVHVYFTYTKGDDDGDKWAVGPDSVMAFVAEHGGSIVAAAKNSDTPTIHVSDPDIEARSLPEALDAYQGDAPFYGPQMSYVVGELPRYDVVGQPFVIDDYYSMKPYLRRGAEKSYSVLFYVAENVNSKWRPEYVVPPRSLKLFRDNLTMYANVAVLSFPLEPGAMPPAYAVHSARFVTGTFAGDVDRADEGLTAWSSAVKDPGWLLQVGMGYASAAQPVQPAAPGPAVPNLRVLPGGRSFAAEATSSTAGTTTATARTSAVASRGSTALALDPAPVVAPVAPPAPAPAPAFRPGLVPMPSHPIAPPSPPISLGAGAALQVAGHAVSQAVAPATNQKQKQKKPPIPITLHLPQAKVAHLSRYRSLVASRTLFHSMAYERGDPAQRDVWKREIRPLNRGRARGAMEFETYRRGAELLRENDYARGEVDVDDKVLVPHWSRTQKPKIPTEVDHVIELQLLGPNWRQFFPWSNTFGNFEVLDKSANASSGGAFNTGIRREREVQANYYNDQRWRTTYDLVFDRVEADGGGQNASVRWLDQDVSNGEHIDALERLLGITGRR